MREAETLAGRRITRRRFLGMVGAGATLAAIPSTYMAESAEAVAAPDPAGLIVGVIAQFTQGKSNLSDHLPQLSSAGVGYIKEGFNWGRIEYQKGKYRMPDSYNNVVNQANQRGIKTLVKLGGTWNQGHSAYDGGRRPTSLGAIEGFTKYCEFVVRHFGSRVQLYEIWNEWDINGPGGTPTDTATVSRDYVDLIKVVGPRLRTLARNLGINIRVLGPAATMFGVISRDFLERTLKLGLLNYVDGVSYHMYNYKLASNKRSAESWASILQSTQNKLKSYNGGRLVPVYITEGGRPTGSAEFTDASQAEYLTRKYLLGRSLPYLEGSWWYHRRDYIRSNGVPQYLGVRRLNETAKPSYTALSVMQNALKGYRFERRLTTGLGGAYNAGTDYVFRFVNVANSTQYKLVAWTTGNDHIIVVPFSQPRAEVTTMLGSKSTALATSGKLTLAISRAPKYVRPVLI